MINYVKFIYMIGFCNSRKCFDGCYFGKVDWASGTLVTSPYDANSIITGYDLLYTDN